MSDRKKLKSSPRKKIFTDEQASRIGELEMDLDWEYRFLGEDGNELLKRKDEPFNQSLEEMEPINRVIRLQQEYHGMVGKYYQSPNDPWKYKRAS